MYEVAVGSTSRVPPLSPTTWTSYLVSAEPLFSGLDQVRSIFLSPNLVVGVPTGPGRTSGRIAADRPEGSESPTAFVARTEKV